MDSEEKQRVYLQSIIDTTADEFGIPRKTLRIKSRRQAGICRKRYIVIADWTLQQPEAMQIYLVIHEICHDIAGWKNSHNGHFKEIEEKALLSWGITEVCRPKKYIKAVKMDGIWYSWSNVTLIKEKG